MSRFRIACPSCGEKIGGRALNDMTRGIPSHWCDVPQSYTGPIGGWTAAPGHALSHPGYRPGSAADVAYRASEQERRLRLDGKPLEPDPEVRADLKAAWAEVAEAEPARAEFERVAMAGARRRLRVRGWLKRVWKWLRRAG